MAETIDPAARISAIRDRVVALEDDVREASRVSSLPDPPSALAEYRRRIEENAYNILVVGEAKRGKSSFVNALIGRALLPTDVMIATSQVFRIRHAPTPSFRLRFEDGSCEEIVAADLARYGSQVVADLDGAPNVDQVIRWIEIDVPVRFLPPGVNVLDTPGLGSLYAAHSEITQRFVPHADAVIYVLESGQVVGDLDLQYLDTILAATPDVFFIQTKIDQHRGSQWQEIRRRNEGILRERFGDQLTDLRIWPISSHLLLKAAETGDEDYEVVSRHRELAAALRVFLYRAAGQQRAAAALALIGVHHAAGRATLAARLEALGDESKQQMAQIQQLAMERQTQFDRDWGSGGAKRAELTDGIRRVIGVGKQSYLAAIRPGGIVLSPFESRIEHLDSVAAANQLAETLAVEMVAATLAEWQRVCTAVRAQAIALLEPFLADAHALGFPPNVEPASLDPRLTRALRINDSVIDKLSRAQLEGGRMAALAGIGGAVAVSLIAAPVIVPIAAAAAAGAWLWGSVRGWKSKQQDQIDRARAELRRLYQAVAQQIQRQFSDVDLTSGRFSLIDEYFGDFDRMMVAEVRAIAERRSAESRAEIERLAAAGKLDGEQRVAQAHEVKMRLTTWDAIGDRLAAAAAELAALERELAPPERVGAA